MKPRSVPPPIGSFEDAEMQNARRMAALTPAQRVKVICAMDAISRRVAKYRRGLASKAKRSEPGRGG